MLLMSVNIGKNICRQTQGNYSKPYEGFPKLEFHYTRSHNLKKIFNSQENISFIRASLRGKK